MKPTTPLFLAVLMMLAACSRSEADPSDGGPTESITMCPENEFEWEAGASCTGSFDCVGRCSDNWPVGMMMCEFGCNRFACIDGEFVATQEVWVGECLQFDAGVCDDCEAGVSTDGGA